MNFKNKERAATVGLVFITIWMAVQYVFISSLPDEVPDFGFLCITNALGFVLLSAARIKKIRFIKKATLLKGMVLALELLGYNFFLFVGSAGLDSMGSSSIISMYVVFVTPLLAFLGRKVSFRNVVASVVAVIALLLIFEADATELFSTSNVLYLILSAFFFATYVVCVKVLGEDENPSALAVSQLLFGTIFGVFGWLIQCRAQHIAFALPESGTFWVIAAIYGILVRGLYSLVQISAQKHVLPIKASLILSSEVIITLLLNPLISKFLKTPYTHPTWFQMIGCVLFISTLIIVDDRVMSRFGFHDKEDIAFTGEDGKTVKGSSISRKTVNLTLMISIVSMVLSTLVCLGAAGKIRKTAVNDSEALGKQVAVLSEESLKTELENEMMDTVNAKAEITYEKLKSYAITAQNIASYAEMLLSNPEDFTDNEIPYPDIKNGGIMAMQRYLADTSVSYDSVREENALLGNMEAVFGPVAETCPEFYSVYLGTGSGLMLCYDASSELSYTGGECYYDFFSAAWYLKGLESDGPAFTEPYQDGFGRGLIITCACPFYGEDGEIYGVVAIDFSMSYFNENLINDGIKEGSEAALITDSGVLVASQKLDSDLIGFMNIRSESFNSPIRLVSEEILSGNFGLTAVESENSMIYVAFTEVESTSWKFCLATPASDVTKKVLSISESIDDTTGQMTSSIEKSIRNVIQYCLILFAVIILLITFFVGKYSERLSEPLMQLEKDVRAIAGGDLKKRTAVATDDEIGSLAVAFNHMTESLEEYIVELKDVTAKEERIASELSLATDIQASMLPRVFPAFPDHKEFDIYASMDPAKEVGGDFYDFFLLDETHLGLVMADVSGKGVPAALFMVIAKTLLKNRANMGGKPSDILAYVNDQLLENNSQNMFVTVWLGILDLESGMLTAANAGHEFPVIKRGDGAFELLKDRHGLVLAGLPGMKYQDYEITLEPGDKLFLYTDGVPEATNGDNELFGPERLVEVLNKEPFENCEKLLNTVKQGILDFVMEAPQFDDITMMCLDYKGGNN